MREGHPLIGRKTMLDHSEQSDPQEAYEMVKDKTEYCLIKDNKEVQAVIDFEVKGQTLKRHNIKEELFQDPNEV